MIPEWLFIKTDEATIPVFLRWRKTAIEKLMGSLETALPVLVMILLGYFCRRNNLIPKDGIAGMKAMLIRIIIPVVLVRAFYNATYSMDIVIIAIIMLSCCLIAFALGFVINKLVGSKLRTLPYLMSGFEAGMLGYALFTILFGAENIRYFAIIDLGQVVFVFTIYLTMLLPSEEMHTVKDAIKRILTSRMFIAIIIGLAIGVSGLGYQIDHSIFGGTFQNILKTMTAPIAAIVLLVVGYELDIGKMNLKLTAITVLSRMIIMGVLCLAATAAISSFYSINEYIKWALVLMFIMPPPFIAVYVDDKDENALICPTVFIYTLITLSAFVFISYAVA